MYGKMREEKKTAIVSYSYNRFIGKRRKCIICKVQWDGSVGVLWQLIDQAQLEEQKPKSEINGNIM